MSKYSNNFFSAVVVMLTVFMLINPQETVAAAAFGFTLWYTTVFPALFPFFVVAELLIGLGFVKILGLWLEPIMRPIFNLPGCSSLVVVMGFTSGFPVGALLTRKLYEQQMLTTDEAERLVSFTNNSSPLFIVGAIGVGMFGSPSAGYLLAAGHYLSNLLIGILGRFRTPRHKLSYPKQNHDNSTIVAINTPVNSFGTILGNSVNNALNSILAVGGFIVIFSVITRMLTHWGFITLMAHFLTKILSFLKLSYPLAYGLSMGLFEITLGSKTVAASNYPEMLPMLLVVSAILAFSGLSIIAQITSIVAGMPISLSFYLKNRILQILLSVGITYLIYKLLPAHAISTMGAAAIPVYKILYSFNAWVWSLYSMLAGGFLIFLMLGVAWCKRP